MNPNNILTLLLIPLMIVAFYFLLIRPQRKRQQQQQRLINELRPGSRVLTHSGIFGTLVSIGDKQAVIEVSAGQEVTVLRQAISRAVGPEDEDGFVPDEAPTDQVAGQESAPVQSSATGATGEADAAAEAAGAGSPQAGHETSAESFSPYRPTEPSSLDLNQDASSGGIRDVTDSYFSRPDEGDAGTEAGDQVQEQQARKDS